MWRKGWMLHKQLHLMLIRVTHKPTMNTEGNQEGSLMNATDKAAAEHSNGTLCSVESRMWWSTQTHIPMPTWCATKEIVARGQWGIECVCLVQWVTPTCHTYLLKKLEEPLWKTLSKENNVWLQTSKAPTFGTVRSTWEYMHLWYTTVHMTYHRCDIHMTWHDMTCEGQGHDMTLHDMRRTRTWHAYGLAATQSNKCVSTPTWLHYPITLHTPGDLISEHFLCQWKEQAVGQACSRQEQGALSAPLITTQVLSLSREGNFKGYIAFLFYEQGGLAEDCLATYKHCYQQWQEQGEAEED